MNATMDMGMQRPVSTPNDTKERARRSPILAPLTALIPYAPTVAGVISGSLITTIAKEINGAVLNKVNLTLGQKQIQHIDQAREEFERTSLFTVEDLLDGVYDDFYALSALPKNVSLLSSNTTYLTTNVTDPAPAPSRRKRALPALLLPFLASFLVPAVVAATIEVPTAVRQYNEQEESEYNLSIKSCIFQILHFPILISILYFLMFQDSKRCWSMLRRWAIGPRM